MQKTINKTTDLRIETLSATLMARELLSLATYIKSHCPLQIKYRVGLPQATYEGVTRQTFQEVFSDVLIETQADIEQFLEIEVGLEYDYSFEKIGGEYGTL